MVTQFAFGTDLAQIGTMSDVHSEDKTLFDISKEGSDLDIQLHKKS